jgi:hypothetical protein
MGGQGRRLAPGPHLKRLFARSRSFMAVTLLRLATAPAPLNSAGRGSACGQRSLVSTWQVAARTLVALARRFFGVQALGQKRRELPPGLPARRRGPIADGAGSLAISASPRARGSTEEAADRGDRRQTPWPAVRAPVKSGSAVHDIEASRRSPTGGVGRES